MTVEVRFFASLVEAVGQSTLSLELDPQRTPAELWAELGRDHPRLAEVGFRPLVAADLSYTPWEAPIGEVREIAFLPPLSGG